MLMVILSPLLFVAPGRWCWILKAGVYCIIEMGSYWSSWETNNQAIESDYPPITISWASLICRYVWYLEMNEWNVLFHWNDQYCFLHHVFNRNLLCPISHQQTRVMEGASQSVLREHRLCAGSCHQCQWQRAAEHVQWCRHSLPDRQQCVCTHP